MWKLYLKSDEGIALQTSFGNLRAELNSSARLIRLGRVRYQDYKEKRSIPGAKPYPMGRSYVVGTFAPFIHKRLGFSHENEIRGVFRDAYESLDDPSEAESGIPVNVNVKKLVESVYVAPGTQVWFRKAVQSVLQRFGLDRDVRQSEFDEPPAY